MKIFGAGLAGLLAGCIFPEAELIEAGVPDQAQHKAVLRFRSSSVGDAVGIEFRKVRVHKGLWLGGRFVKPDIRTANWYAQKVSGRVVDRSIWNLDACDRWIAPEDLLPQLAARCGKRIRWGYTIGSDTLKALNGEPVVSTLPMSVMMRIVAEPLPPFPFDHSQISVRRWRIPGADVFQTIYFPDPHSPLYRASITGDLLIAESIGGSVYDFEDMFDAFGINMTSCEELGPASIQKFGKIRPIDDAWRKQFIFNLTQNHNVFSLGRFGTWRNILLDDVLHDISVIRRLMSTAAAYDFSRRRAGAL